MNWEAIGAIGEIIGALAVFATLLYLANQIRQANNIASYNTSSDLLDKFNDFNKSLISEPYIIELTDKLSEKSYQPKSDKEDAHLYTFVNVQCNLWVAIEFAYTNSQIDKDFYNALKLDVSVALERWPSSKPYILKWLNNYPWTKDLGIFDLFREN